MKYAEIQKELKRLRDTKVDGVSGLSTLQGFKLNQKDEILRAKYLEVLNDARTLDGLQPLTLADISEKPTSKQAEKTETKKDPRFKTKTAKRVYESIKSGSKVRWSTECTNREATALLQLTSDGYIKALGKEVLRYPVSRGRLGSRRSTQMETTTIVTYAAT